MPIRVQEQAESGFKDPDPGWGSCGVKVMGGINCRARRLLLAGPNSDSKFRPFRPCSQIRNCRCDDDAGDCGSLFIPPGKSQGRAEGALCAGAGEVGRRGTTRRRRLLMFVGGVGCLDGNILM